MLRVEGIDPLISLLLLNASILFSLVNSIDHLLVGLLVLGLLVLYFIDLLLGELKLLLNDEHLLLSPIGEIVIISVLLLELLS